MHSKLLLLVPIVLAGVECLSTYSNARAQQPNSPGNWTLGLPAFGSLLRRDDSPDSQVDYWVFTVRIGHGKDTELDDIRKYIQAELGSDRKKTKEKWARNVKGGIMWFYLKCSKGTAEHIVKQWEKSIQNFSSVEARIKEFEASLLLDPTIETLKAKMNGGDKDTDTDNVDPKLHKRSYLLELDEQRPETCMVSKHPNAKDPAPDSPCTYETNSSQGRGVIVYYTSASGKHYPGWYVECLAEVLERIENNMKKSEGSAVPGAGQYLILSNLQLPLPVGTSERTQLDEVFEKLRALDNVVYVSSAGNGNPPPDGQRRRPTPWKEQYRHDPILKSMVPMGYGYDDANYNLIIVGGTDHTGRIIFQTAPFVRVSAPAENIELAVGQVGFFRGAGYELSHGTSVSSPAVAGVLATYISAYGDTVLEAKDRLYRLAYPRADIQAMPEDQRKLYPPVVFNSFGRDPNAAKGKDNDCAVNQRRIIRRANGTATTVLEGEACPTPTSKNTKQERPQGKFSLEPNATFCKVCVEAGGEFPVGGIIWIPEDCPCL
ncbi:hypothetical protein TWF788_000740 [Orbilia oligospora]|uniref:Peptidase S8/S53 domain-containing protein n=1 Tax=Orbilia oligospora TaxID=2813651 RepID=A0A7C8PFD7_ORBOL|nr:hypothetical protein TWF788_000740 [Orbilia oligospora]